MKWFNLICFSKYTKNLSVLLYVNATELNDFSILIPDPVMDHKTFKEFSNAMTEYIANYLENIRER